MYYFSNYKQSRNNCRILFLYMPQITMSLNMSHDPKTPEEKEPTQPCSYTPAEFGTPERCCWWSHLILALVTRTEFWMLHKRGALGDLNQLLKKNIMLRRPGSPDVTGVFKEVISLNGLLNPWREIFALMGSYNHRIYLVIPEESW